LSTIKTKLEQLKKLKPDIPINIQDRMRPLLKVADELLTKASKDLSGALRAKNQRLSNDIDELAQILNDGEDILRVLNAAYEDIEGDYYTLITDYQLFLDELERKKPEDNEQYHE
jgi:hypothetical protein